MFPNRFARNRRTSTGFTLIELLVVIAIIAILASILFPVFAQARAKARQTSCLSNLKQIGLSMLMYVQDYDETFPTSWAKGWVGDPNFFVQPYMKNTKVLICPEKTISASTANTACGPGTSDDYGTWDFTPGGRDNPTKENYLWGYGFNMGITWSDGTGLLDNGGTAGVGGGTTVPVTIGGVTIQAVVRGNPKIGKTLASCAAPSLLLMEGDTNEPPLSSIDLNAMRPAGWTGYTDTPCEKVVRAGSPRHNKGNNFVYADGHAKWQNYPGKATNFGDPSSVADICSYFREYDGGNNPAQGDGTPSNCKTLGFKP